MLQSYRFTKIFLLILGCGCVGHTSEPCLPSSNTEISLQAQGLAKTTCVSTCTEIFGETSAQRISEFSENCESFARQHNSGLKEEAAAEVQKSVEKALLLCLPVAAKNTVVGTYELIKALPGLVGYLLSGVWSKNIDAARMESLEFCKGSPDCRRAIARNTIRFQNKKSDGTWQISDQEVDRQIFDIDFNDLQRQAVHDLPLAKDECLGFLGALRKKMVSDGEEWTEERHQTVAKRLAQDHPHCPEILKIAELEVPKAPDETLAECLGNKKKNAFSCLSMGEMFTVSIACNGLLETCAAVTEFFIPVPGVGPQAKFFKMLKGGKAPPSVIQGGVEMAESKPARLLSLPQKRFVSSFKERVFVSEAQNRRYISIAEDSAKNAAENKTRYFDVENSVMKTLNDKTNDKELVTSLTNFQKETVLKRVAALKDKYPEVDFEVYSDFKSVKIVMKSSKEIDAATNQKILADLNKLYAESNSEFAEKMKELGIAIPEAGSADQWFKAGYGRSVDEAAIAARKARKSPGAGVFEYASPEVRESMNRNLEAIEKKRQALAQAKDFAPLMEKNGKGVSLPREDVFDLVRKNEDPNTLAKAISQRYELADFTTKDATQLQDYVNGVNEFSPTILVAKRETVNLDGAIQGGLSADFLGMGAANLKATAEGIAKKDSLDTALIGAREGEKKVTGIFTERMRKFKKIVGDASCSGDDCAMAKLMSDKQKLDIMQKLARNPETRGVRMSFIGSNVSPEVRMQLASHGESIEKTFRKELEGKIPHSKLSKMTFGFDMKSTQLNQGSVNLLIGKGKGTRISAKEQIEMRQAFATALQKQNAEKSAVYAPGSESFSSSQIYWVPGISLIGDDEEEP